MMVTIESLVTGERMARIALAMVAEPDDAFTGWLVGRRGAVETLRLLRTEDPIRGVDAAETALWRRRLLPRLDANAIGRTLGESEYLGLRVLVPSDGDWPKGLSVLRERAPLALWVKGDPGTLREARLREVVTFTGARAATSYGEDIARNLAEDVVSREGGVVVSGGAYGIDGAAHRAALASGGRTVAILAGGLDRPYPSGHRDLLERVGREGLLVSELPPGSAPTRRRFLARNRLLVSGRGHGRGRGRIPFRLAACRRGGGGPGPASGRGAGTSDLCGVGGLSPPTARGHRPDRHRHRRPACPHRPGTCPGQRGLLPCDADARDAGAFRPDAVTRHRRRE